MVANTNLRGRGRTPRSPALMWFGLEAVHCHVPRGLRQLHHQTVELLLRNHLRWSARRGEVPALEHCLISFVMSQGRTRRGRGSPDSRGETWWSARRPDPACRSRRRWAPAWQAAMHSMHDQTRLLCSQLPGKRGWAGGNARRHLAVHVDVFDYYVARTAR